jgi:hypothetical protein
MTCGRLISKDARDSQYRLRSPRPAVSSKTWHSYGWHGNQHGESSCVGHAWAHWLHCSPVRQFVDPSGLYHLAQHYDEWDGVDYEGTSVRAGAKVLSLLGAIGEYRWATTARQVANHILTTGPVVVGTDWYEGMEEPDGDLMTPTGEYLGGHAYVFTGYNSKYRHLRVKQSRGDRWGNRGYGVLALSDFSELLSEDGEACVGTETDLRQWK